MRPPHSRGGVDVGGSEAAASISKEAAEMDTADWSRVVGCVGSTTLTRGRSRWLYKLVRRVSSCSLGCACTVSLRGTELDPMPVTMGFASTSHG